MVQDLRFAVRMLNRQRAYALTGVSEPLIGNPQ